ncbi:T9SS type A sorting domain-containing protein [candidate division KSB1 bacterium]|nr:T9SS type A sorting domain-containing protein [candidate division KSB1 bacterium]
MKRRVSVFLTVFLMLTSWAMAQESGWWEPENPQPGDSLTIFYDAEEGTIPDDTEQLLLHWGINGVPGAWNLPPEESWPPGTIPHSGGTAVQSPMAQQPDGLWVIEIATLDTFEVILLVFTNGSSWDNNSSQDWTIHFGEGPEPIVHEDTVGVEIMVDLAPAIQNRGFTYGDTVEARLGAYATADSVITIDLLRQGISSYYRGNGEVTTTIGDTLDYTYFAYNKGDENWEVYYNYDYSGDIQSEAQYRQVVVTGSSISIADTVRNNSGHGRRPPFFRNLSIIAQDVLVTLTCDVRPAYYHLLGGGNTLEDIQGTLDVVNPDDAINWGLAANGPITGSWSNDVGADWGPQLLTIDNKVMYDDGTHGDVAAGDSIYSTQYQFSVDSAHTVGQEFKFGIGGGDNEGGEGGFGNNHVENIDDSQSASTIAAQFGSINPVFYSEWDYDIRIPVGVAENPSIQPEQYTLNQNYPNPFNPTTLIEYQLAKSQKVTIRIYNVLGKEIVTLIHDQAMDAGSHRAVWNGTDHSGQMVGAGVYIYEIQAGAFTDSKKMLFLK